MKPLLVGEANPYGGDPEFALYPRPRGCAGDRLCRLVMGMSEREYLRAFDRVNLCSTSWSLRSARERAAAIAERPGPIVLLGARVAQAFGLEYRPFTALQVTKFVLLPHPSGRSRAWNESGAYDRARAVLREVGALP